MARETGILGIQIGNTGTKEENLNRALAMIDSACARYNKLDLICLPELFTEQPTKENRGTIGEPADGPFFRAFSEAARKHRVNIITGSFPMRQGEKLYNTCLCIDREGKLLGSYSKTHLFDAFAVRESDTCDAGSEARIVQFDFGKVGLAICYELRFQDYLRTLALSGADILCIPAAFYRPRQDQWDILTNCAALGNLIYVCAVNQYSSDCFGRSRLVDPFGLVVAQCSDREGCFYGIADLDEQARLRELVPTYRNRRPELDTCTGFAGL